MSISQRYENVTAESIYIGCGFVILLLLLLLLLLFVCLFYLEVIYRDVTVFTIENM